MKIKENRWCIFRKAKKCKINIFIITLVLLILTGFTLNFKLVNYIKKQPDEIIIDEKEKKFLIDIQTNKEIDRNEFEKEYIKLLEDIKKEPENEKSNDNIGKVYYFLGFNSYLDNNKDKAIEYYKQCVRYLENGTNYFYLLNVYNDLMNIYFSNSNSIEAFKQASNIYILFQKTKIEGISEGGQAYIKASVLAGLLSTTSDYGMTSVSDKFYNEIVELTEGKDKEKYSYNTPIYAKYRYNLNNENYEKAKEYAKEYIEFFNDKSDLDIGGAHIYLLEALVQAKEFDKIEEVFLVVENAYAEFNDPMLFAYLDKVKGIYYEGLGEYEIALEYLDQSMNEFEKLGLYNYCTDVSKIIINMHDKIDLDLDKYIAKEILYKKDYDYITELGNLADSLVALSFEKSEEENIKMSKEIDIYNDINQTSKKLNVIYIVVIGFLLIITNTLKKEIEKRKLKELELQRMVETDYLTKAYSKQYSYGKVNKLIQDKKEFAIILIDLDDFKIINDKYGHLFGDEVLVSIVNAIKNNIKDNGFIGRFGGEEFIIIYENIVDNNIAESLITTISNIEWYKENFKVTISGGMKIHTNNYEDIDSLIYDVDMLLYKAKSEGKNKILME